MVKDKENAIGIVIALPDWYVILIGSWEKTFVKQVYVNQNLSSPSKESYVKYQVTRNTYSYFLHTLYTDKLEKNLIFRYSDLLKDQIPRITNGKIGENGVIVLEIVEVLESDQDIEFAFHHYLEAMNALP